jgi:agmatinase
MTGALAVNAGSFARAPQRDLGGEWQAEAAVLGVPTDAAVGFRAGARWGPRALRDASLRYALEPQGFFDLARARAVLAGFDLVDVGDVALERLQGEAARERITSAAEALREHARLCVFLGGDHSISFPLLRAFADVDELFVVQLDAHLDFSDRRGEDRYSNGSPFRRAVEALPQLAHITVVGLRGIRTDPEAFAAAQARGHTLFTAADVHDDLAAVIERLPSGRRAYLSFDVDVLDPSVLPGTGSPEVDGLVYRQVAELVRAVAQRNDILAADVVELAPTLDPSGLSALVAARAVIDLFAAVRG